MFGTLREKLAATRRSFERVGLLFRSGKPREEILDELAEALILADIGVPTAESILQRLRETTRKDASAGDLEAALEAELERLLAARQAAPADDSRPAVVMIVGVNGGGKTTSAAKLAAFHKRRGRRVMMAAADTFRAAAQEQLIQWGRRLDIPVVRGQYGADPASVVFDALQSFKAQKADLLVIDTAGRIHTNTNLMNELEKIRRVLGREIEGAPQETLLVLDATTGQNALSQAREFLKFSGLTGIFLTKLDGTAKGGAAVGIAKEFALPIRFIGVGESEEDILEFSPREFVKALLT